MKELKSRASDLMDDKDSLIIFTTRQEKWLKKEVLGEERSPTGIFL